MELILAKTVLLASGGFVFGGGFTLFKLADDYRRHGALPSASALREHTPAAAAAAPAAPTPSPSHLLAWLRAALLETPHVRPPPAWLVAPFSMATGGGGGTRRGAVLALQMLSLATVEGARTARVLGVGTLVAGSVGLLRHGRERCDALLDVRRDRASACCGVAAAC